MPFFSVWRIGVAPKSYLPNYREFYEKRHFSAARQAVEVRGRELATAVGAEEHERSIARVDGVGTECGMARGDPARLVQCLSNLLINPRIGLLFLVPGTVNALPVVGSISGRMSTPRPATIHGACGSTLASRCKCASRYVTSGGKPQANSSENINR